MSKKKATRKSPAATFETSLERLNQIVDQLEGGELELSQSLEQFEEGIGLIKNCYQLLEHAERRIERLTGVDDDGRPETVPQDELPDSDSDD